MLLDELPDLANGAIEMEVGVALHVSGETPRVIDVSAATDDDMLDTELAARGLDNRSLALAGFSQGGGVGLALANWSIAGGAGMLFMTNLLAIALSVTAVARALRTRAVRWTVSPGR